MSAAPAAGTTTGPSRPVAGVEAPAEPAATSRIGPDPACGARIGRPRSAAADAAILEATVDLFADRGFEGVSIEAVAERAGVAKSTVYRRFPTKIDLVMAAWHHCSPAADEPIDTGTVEGDLLAAAHRLRAVFTQSPVGRVVPAALAAAARFPEFADAHGAFIAARRAPVIAAVERAVARGELRAGTDPALVVDLVTGAIFYRAFSTRSTLTDDDLAAIVTHAAASFR